MKISIRNKKKIEKYNKEKLKEKGEFVYAFANLCTCVVNNMGMNASFFKYNIIISFKIIQKA